MVRHDEITKNNKQAISLQCFKKEVNDEVDFSDAGNQENFYKLMLRFLTEIEYEKFTKSLLRVKIFRCVTSLSILFT